MLPIGAIRQGQEDSWTPFTNEELRTMMILWSIARSPLILGGHLPKNDEFTWELITNDEVIAVNQASGNNCQLFCSASQAAWIADVPESADRYLALFNLSDVSATVAADIGKVSIRDFWSDQELGSHKGTLEV